MKRYIKIMIVLAVMMTLITPSAGIGRVFAEENDITVESTDAGDAGPVQETSSDEESKGSENSDAASEEDAAKNTDVIPQESDEEEEVPEGDYYEWQTDIDEYDGDETASVTFVLSGADSVKAAIGVNLDSDEGDVEFSETIHNGDTREFLRGTSVYIDGIEGSYIRASYGRTEEEAVNNPDPEISKEGQAVSVAQDGSGFIYIKVAQKKEDVVDENTHTYEVADDENGTITYSDVSTEDAKAGRTQSSFPKAGQEFTGMATIRDYYLRGHLAIGYLDPDNGWLKENTTLRSIAAVCISGPSKSMARRTAKFIYVCKILSSDPATGKVQVGITFKPLSNTFNIRRGKVGTQILYKATYVTIHPKTGYVTLRKKQAARKYSYAASFPGNYSLQGARYRLYSDASCSTEVRDVSGQRIEFVTGKSGTTDIYEVEPGTYYAKEIAASKGFRLDRTAHKVTVTTDNNINKPAEITSEEVPGYTDLGMILVKENDNYGYKRLAGTKYELTYYDTDPDHPVLDSSTLKATWIYETRYMETQEGLKTAGIDFAADDPVSGTPYIEDGKKVLPLGVIRIRETVAPKGMAVDKRVYTGTVRLTGDAVKLSVNGQDSLTVRYDDRLTHDEEYKSVRISVQKVDAETGQPAAEGSGREYSAGSLEGAVFNVYFEDTDLSRNEKVGEIITDKDGRGELLTDSRTGDKLRPGRYYVEEAKASPGYVVDSLYEKDEKNKYDEGKHIVLARADLDSGIQEYEYLVTSHEMHHETFISKTDAVTCDELPGARLQVINSDGNIVEEWISGNEPHLIKALPDGKYTLREITAPYGYDIAEDAVFEVKEDRIANKVTMKNKPVTISTQAADSETSSHAGIFSTEEKITDSVRMTGLTIGRRYKVTGHLIDKDTGEKIENAEAEQEFEAVSDEMTIELQFTIDSSQFTKESSVVAFEKLFRISKVHETEDETVPVELQKHEDPDDEDQSVHYGGIAYTEAKGGDGEHLIAGTEDTVITDTVAFSNLSARQEYRLEGELYDKTDGKLLGITSEATFTPAETDGTTDMEFSLDASGLKGHSIVAFERLYAGDTLIDEHCDPEDKAQTVYIKREPEKKPAPKTGDDNLMKLYAIVAVLAAVELIFIYSGRRYRR